MMLSSSKLGIDGCVDVIIDGLRGMGEMEMNKDLTVGNPEKVLWQFCLPLFGSIIFQQLYNIADSLVDRKIYR